MDDEKLILLVESSRKLYDKYSSLYKNQHRKTAIWEGIAKELETTAEEETREIQFWVANSKNSSFLSMAIKGQQIFRLNYPLRTRQWHHICTSWNGKTGEWQVWLKAERIGRGFQNSLVGHKIPAEGKLYSGGASVTGEVNQGLHFEITLMQIYRIALTAGKAHRDHKHHHAHHFHHEGQELSSTTIAPKMMNAAIPTMNNLLSRDQTSTRARINLAHPSQAYYSQNFQNFQHKLLGSTHERHEVTINSNFVNGQINTESRSLSEQLIGQPNEAKLHPESREISPKFNKSDNAQFVDETETRIFFKRHTETNGSISAMKPNNILTNTNENQENKFEKRNLVLLEDSHIFKDIIVEPDYIYEGLTEFGGQQFRNVLTGKINIESYATLLDREPAEKEVKAVMAICGSCDIEPFQGAISFAWRDAREKVDNALKGLSVGRCEHF